MTLLRSKMNRKSRWWMLYYCCFCCYCCCCCCCYWCCCCCCYCCCYRLFCWAVQVRESHWRRRDRRSSVRGWQNYAVTFGGGSYVWVGQSVERRSKKTWLARTAVLLFAFVRNVMVYQNGYSKRSHTACQVVMSRVKKNKERKRRKYKKKREIGYDIL